MTFHYRRDAVVYAPYGSIHLVLKLIAESGDDDVDIMMRRKNKLAIWFVSNCNISRARMAYARDLTLAGLEIDGYGDCFGGRRLDAGRNARSFHSEISKYKFYLAFENSVLCKDYITEKFWFNGLRSGAVPIVWGPTKADVLAVAPSNSFIHVDDFKSPWQLVDYLHFLDGNDAAYRKYLEWRTWVKYPERVEERLKLKNVRNDLRSFCLLCGILQQEGKRRKLRLPATERRIKSVVDSWKDPDGMCHEKFQKYLSKA